MKFFMSMLLVLSVASASEINMKLVKDLASDDFLTREKATEELKKAPFDQLERLIVLAGKSEDPEAQLRLNKICHAVFCDYAYNHDQRILNARMDNGANFECMKVLIDHGKPASDPNATEEWEVLFVNHIVKDGPADNKFEAFDLVLTIDGAKAADAKIDVLDLNKTYKVEVLRHKPMAEEASKTYKTNVQVACGSRIVLAIKEEDYEKKIIEMKPRFKDLREAAGMIRLLDEAYQEYLDKRKSR